MLKNRSELAEWCRAWFGKNRNPQDFYIPDLLADFQTDLARERNDRLAELEKRYEFAENQRLCKGYGGHCDGYLKATRHDQDCPAYMKDKDLRPYLYPTPKSEQNPKPHSAPAERDTAPEICTAPANRTSSDSGQEAPGAH